MTASPPEAESRRPLAVGYLLPSMPVTYPRIHNEPRHTVGRRAGRGWAGGLGRQHGAHGGNGRDGADHRPDDGRDFRAAGVPPEGRSGPRADPLAGHGGRADLRGLPLGILGH